MNAKSKTYLRISFSAKNEIIFICIRPFGDCFLGLSLKFFFFVPSLVRLAASTPSRPIFVDDFGPQKTEARLHLFNFNSTSFLSVSFSSLPTGSISNIDGAEYHCNKTQVRKVISGVVGAASSVTSIQVANLLRLFRIPQVIFLNETQSSHTLQHRCSPAIMFSLPTTHSMTINFCFDSHWHTRSSRYSSLRHLLSRWARGSQSLCAPSVWPKTHYADKQFYFSGRFCVLPK